jgi:hypothetical protein
MGSFLRRSILVDAVIYYPGVAQMLLEFGADPNALDEDGASAFSVIAAVNGGKYLRADTLRMIMEAGGDVNLTGSHSSPAQTIVSSEGNAEIVEALIQTGKVEWCRSMDPYWGQRTIDRVSAEHLPLLRRYGISCSRFKRVFGKGESCALAKDAGRMQCMNEGFQFATLGPTRNGAECIIYREAQEGPEMYLATYFCSDESLDLSPNYAQESTLSIELATIRTLRCP